MKSTFAGVAIVVSLLTTTAPAQTIPHLEFESATLKPRIVPPGSYFLKPYTHGPPFVIPTSNTFSETVHVQDLIMEAYGVSEYQILYLPAFMRSRDGIVYDIQTKAKGDHPPTPAEYQQMMQSLLADKFHLKVHWETKPKFTVYALVADKNGPKFHESEPAAGGTTIFALAHFLSPNMDFPVIDTGFPPNKSYDFDIDSLVDYHEIDREQAIDPLQAQDYLRSSVLGVLGLKLDQRKVAMQVLAVDHIDELSDK